RMVDLLCRQVLVLLAHPPVHEPDERPHEKAHDRFDLEGIELLRRLETRQLRVDKPLEALRRLAPGQRAALATGDCLEQSLPRSEMPEQLERPTEGGVFR